MKAEKTEVSWMLVQVSRPKKSQHTFKKTTIFPTPQLVQTELILWILESVTPTEHGNLIQWLCPLSSAQTLNTEPPIPGMVPVTQWDPSQDWGAPDCREGFSISVFQSHTEAFHSRKMWKELESYFNVFDS